MKFSKIFALFLTLLILNSTLSKNIIVKTSKNENDLSNYVCKITKDITESSSDIQDVLIGNLGEGKWSKIVNDIANCIGQGSAVVFNDLKDNMFQKMLRKAAVVVFTFKSFNEVTSNKFIQSRYSSESTVWNFMAKTIAIVPNEISKKDIQQALETFSGSGFHNLAVIQESKEHRIFSFFLADLMPKEISELSQPNASIIFPDKLRNMKGYPYKVVTYQQRPRLVILNGFVRNFMTYFLSALNKAQNSTTKHIFVRNEKEVLDHIKQRKMHLTLNSGLNVRNPEKPLLTYEENGYCALVPVPPKVPIFQSILIEPFDGLTWVFFAITMTCSVVVWWMFRGRGAVDSPWLLAYGIFVMFIGQGVDFSRKNRLVLVILLQLIIVMTWILSNAYEGVITSFMIEPIHEHRLETFDDLVVSNHKVMSDVVFASRISESEAYKVLKPRLNTSGAKLGTQFSIELTKKNYAFILTCDQAKVIIHGYLAHASKMISYFYYLMPQTFLPYLVELQAGYLNPFVQRLQHYMDLSFQAGLMHIWKVYENNPYTKTKQLLENETTFLRLEDLTQVFSTLVISYLVSIIAFIIEIFFHDILQKLKLAHLGRMLKNRVHQMAYKNQMQPKHPKYQKGALYYIIHRRKRVKRLKHKKLRVRRIYVQPRFPMD